MKKKTMPTTIGRRRVRYKQHQVVRRTMKGPEFISDEKHPLNSKMARWLIKHGLKEVNLWPIPKS